MLIKWSICKGSVADIVEYKVILFFAEGIKRRKAKIRGREAREGRIWKRVTNK